MALKHQHFNEHCSLQEWSHMSLKNALNSLKVSGLFLLGGSPINVGQLYDFSKAFLSRCSSLIKKPRLFFC